MMLKDGKGGGYYAEVSDENHLKTDSLIQDQATHVSQTHANLYSWTTNHDVVDDEYVLVIKNTSSTHKLCIETIRMSNDTATSVSAGFGTWSTVGGTSLIIGANANKISNNTAEATCYRTATNFTADTTPLLQTVRGANNEAVYRPEGKIVLGQNDCFYVKTSKASTSNCAVIVWGFFKEI